MPAVQHAVKVELAGHAVPAPHAAHAVQTPVGFGRCQAPGCCWEPLLHCLQMRPAVSQGLHHLPVQLVASVQVCDADQAAHQAPCCQDVPSARSQTLPPTSAPVPLAAVQPGFDLSPVPAGPAGPAGDAVPAGHAVLAVPAVPAGHAVPDVPAVPAGPAGSAAVQGHCPYQRWLAQTPGCPQQKADSHHALQMQHRSQTVNPVETRALSLVIDQVLTFTVLYTAWCSTTQAARSHFEVSDTMQYHLFDRSASDFHSLQTSQLPVKYQAKGCACTAVGLQPQLVCHTTESCGWLTFSNWLVQQLVQTKQMAAT